MALVPALVLGAACTAGPPLADANAFVRGLVGAQRQREDAVSRYAYDAAERREEMDREGRVRRRETRAFEVFHVRGRPVRRLVARDSRPLGPKEAAREERRARELAESLRSGRAARELPGVRISRILERYDFTSAGREEVDGRCAWALDFEARPGDARLEGDHLLRRLAGRVWIDEEDRAVARVEVRNTAGLRFALGLGASVRSLSFRAEFRRLEEGAWLPRSVEAVVAGRKLLFRSFRVRTTTTYSNYRRFEVDVEEEVRP
jgi:hypothetical protein